MARSPRSEMFWESPGTGSGRLAAVRAALLTTPAATTSQEPPSQSPLKPTMSQFGVVSVLRRHSERYSTKTALAFYDNGKWSEITFSELRRYAAGLALQLQHLSPTRGERIALLCEGNVQWPIAFFAIVLAGGTVVPLDPGLSQQELQHVIDAAEPSILLTSQQQAEIAASLHGCHRQNLQVVPLDSGRQAPDPHRLAEIEQNLPVLGRRRNDVAVLTYTSGTTGDPKGVMTTFGNLLFEVQALESAIPAQDDDTTLSILPLHHSFGLVAGLLSSLWRGSTAVHCASLFPDDVSECIQRKTPRRIVAVPLFLELLRQKIQKGIDRLPLWKRTFCRLALSGTLAPTWSRRLLRAPRERLFGKLHEIVSGGAPLRPETARFFERLGIDIYQGYGLTETSPVITTNRPNGNRLGSVGQALDGVDVRIAGNDDSGEIQTRGPHVMKGYHNRNDLTEAVLDSEGWFSTGDIGHLDADGYLFITGRAKSIIVLGTGKKVHPEEVEWALEQGPFEGVCVVGSRAAEGIKSTSEEICAVVVPTQDLVEDCGNDPARLAEQIHDEIAKRGASLASFKRPTRVVVRRQPLPLTSTRKVKRRVLTEWVNSLEADVS